MRRSLLALALLSPQACWKVDATLLAADRVALDPEVGAPAGWFVETLALDPTLETRCPDDEPAIFVAVYPADADRRVVEGAPSLPTAIVFHSGAFDFVPADAVDDPRTIEDEGGRTFQESNGGDSRLTLEWGLRRVYTSLGHYPNLDPSESHAGALPAALATKGIAMLWPVNCWGDLWHDRRGVVDNDFNTDLFARDGRTAAEFVFRHALGPFPPANPVELPFHVDTDRLFLVGLGDGGRAIGELLTADGPYTTPVAVLDSPIDDYSTVYGSAALAANAVREGLRRIFPGVDEGNAAEVLSQGAPSAIPTARFPDRLAVLLSDNDLVIPAGANDALLTRIGSGTLDPDDLPLLRTLDPEHILSNADVDLSYRVANFLGGAPLLGP
ncbi:MAG: hypothetical protein H6732_09330 [Alphaproteobacteria bacterium]|nr:hypothetical protein [Alphaproteobacteria bacterium]